MEFEGQSKRSAIFCGTNPIEVLNGLPLQISAKIPCPFLGPENPSKSQNAFFFPFVFLLFCVLNSRIFLFCGIFHVFCQILFFCDGKRSILTIHISRQKDANFEQNSLIFFIIHFHFPLLPLLAAFLRVHGCPAPQSAS